MENKYSIVLPTCGLGDAYELFLKYALPLYEKYLNQEEIFEFGDLKGRWYIQKLEPYYEGMNYTAVINGIKNKVYITPESYKNTTIEFF
jgi:hypothetical protein